MSKTKEKKPGPKFSDYGLDDVKRSRDEGSKGIYCCPFNGWMENFDGPGHEVGVGFSFCFSNWCICPDCVSNSHQPENSHRWYQGDCFKCKKTDIVCYHDTKDGDIMQICEECMDWAAETLKIKIKKSDNMAKKKVVPSFKVGDLVRIKKGGGIHTGKTCTVIELSMDDGVVIRSEVAFKNGRHESFWVNEQLELVEEDLNAKAVFPVGSTVEITEGEYKGRICTVSKVWDSNGVIVASKEKFGDHANQTYYYNNQLVSANGEPNESNTELQLSLGTRVKILQGKFANNVGTIVETTGGMHQVQIFHEGEEPIRTACFNDWLEPYSELKQGIEELLEEEEVLLEKPDDKPKPDRLPKFENVSLASIVEDPNQPRKTFDDVAIRELTDSIKEQGVLQPILLRPDEDGYMIVCGERRYRAAVVAGLETIPATIRNLTDQEALEIQITENLQRKDVDPLEEAESFLVMIEKMGYSNTDIAAKIGKDEKFVARRLKLNGLIIPLRQWMKEHILPLGHAERLASLDQEIQAEWHGHRKGYTETVPTLYQLKQWIKNNVEKKLANAIFDINNDSLAPNAPACTSCSYNSSVFSLFADSEEAVCANRKCFVNKTNTQQLINLREALEDEDTFLINNEWYETDGVKKLKKDGHHVLSRRDFGILSEPKAPVMEEVDREDYEGDEDAYNEALQEAKEEYEGDLDIYKEQLDDYKVNLKESRRAFDVNSGQFIRITHITIGNGSSSDTDNDPQSDIKSEILDLQHKKKRGVELDREKVMKKIVEHMTKNIPEGELTAEEMHCVHVDFLNRIGYGHKSEMVEKKFGVGKFTYSAGEGQRFLDGVIGATPEDIGKMVRLSLLSNYTGIFPQSLSGAISFHLAKQWCPDVLKTAELEQEEARIKREARIDAQIKELEKELK